MSRTRSATRWPSDRQYHLGLERLGGHLGGLAGGIAYALAMGFCGGIFPAVRAVRTPIAVGLRGG